MKNFNKLTPDETERLAVVIEECGEVIQSASKVLRHGYENGHPDGSTSNREDLSREIGDLKYALTMISHDLEKNIVNSAVEYKLKNIGKYLHHN